MSIKPKLNQFIENHWEFLIKACGFAGSMLGSYLGQKAGTKLLGAAAEWSDIPKTPDRVSDRNLIKETGRYDMVIVYHDADKAGPHIDVHIGKMSLIYRVKPELKEKLAFNREGYLTKQSKTLILDHIRSEIDKKARVPQNLDHSTEQTTFGWVNGGSEQAGYGAGKTRQIVHQSAVDVFKIDNAIEFYAPKIDSNREMYIYQLYPGNDKKAPILIWGSKSTDPPKFESRLHLKPLDPNDLDSDSFTHDIDWNSSTAKYDGSSAYFVIGPKGTTAWSPREAKSTGKQIEYTHKLKGLAGVKTNQTVVAMGEVLFMDNTGAYLKGAKISGILNSKEVLPDNVYPEIRLYRIDSVDKLRTYDMDFWKNRELQELICNSLPEFIKPVEFMTPHQAKEAGLEGVVVAPPDKSIIHGFKIKWWRDPNDWRIDKIKLKPGEKGRVAGVVACTSLDSGRQFDLGATAIGNEYQTKHMMENPDLYEGSVLKVISRHGHEGRSAKVVGFHDDKGLAPI